MKVCTTCHLSKPLEAFTNDRSRPDGKYVICRQCRNRQKALQRLACGIPPRLSFLENVWNKIQVCEHGNDCPYCCWPWMGTRDHLGYGRLGIRHTLVVLAPRLIYEIWHARPIPFRLLVLHYCDYPPCTNPHHLWLGSYKDNNHDRNKKGRASMPYGEIHCRAKLTVTDVLAIRSLYAQGMGATQIHRIYNKTSMRNLRSIIDRQIWKHL